MIQFNKVLSDIRQLVYWIFAMMLYPCWIVKLLQLASYKSEAYSSLKCISFLYMKRKQFCCKMRMVFAILKFFV